MSFDSYNLHQLPVVNFNEFSTNLSKCSTGIRAFHDSEQTNSECQRNSIGKTKLLTNKCSECIILQNSSPMQDPKSRYDQIRGREDQIIGGNVSPKKRIVTNKAQKVVESLNSTKQCFSLFSVFSPQIQSKTGNVWKSKPPEKHKSYSRNEQNRVDDVRVLFDRNIRKRFKKLKNRNITTDCRKLDMLYNSKSSANVNKVQPKHKCDHSSLYHLFKCKSKSYLQRCKCYKNKCQVRPRVLHQNINVANKYTSVCECNESAHYKLVNFPHQSDNHCNCFGLKSMLKKQCACKSVAVKPSCLYLCDKGAGDSIQHIEDHNVGINKSINCQKGDGDKTTYKRRRRNFRTKHAFKCDNAYFISVMKSTLKILILAFAIIVWSPCIILLSFYWLITYPLQPKHIVAQAKIDTCNKCGSFFNYGHEFWHTIFHSIINALEKVVNTYNALCCSIRNENNRATKIRTSCLQRSTFAKQKPRKMHKKLMMSAEPKNKYQICNPRHGGWVIQKHIKRTKKEKQKRAQNHGLFQIVNQGDCNKPYFKLSKRPTKRKFKRNKIQNLSKMISTESSPILLRNCTGNENLISNFSGVNNNFNPIFCKEPVENHYKQFSFSNCKCNRRHLRNFYSTGVIPYSSFSPETIYKLRYKYNTGNGKGNNRTTCKYSHRKYPSNKQYLYSNDIALKLPCCNARKNNHPKSHRGTNKRKDGKINFKKECKKITIKDKIYNLYKTTVNRFKDVVQKVESDVWDSNECNELYVSTLRRKPWFWIYKRCPSFYPCFLTMYKFFENIAFCFLLIISTCIWCPIVFCCYFCYALFCQCMS